MKQSLRDWFSRAKIWTAQNVSVLVVIALVLALDRITKVCAQLFWVQAPVVVFPFFHLRYVENTGSAFGMMQGANVLLIFVMLAIIGYLLHSWRELCAQGKLVKWGCVFILAGALGNLYDRITLGYVVDFLDFLVWPVFNVADSAITVGGGLFVVSLLLNTVKKGEEK